MKPVMYQKEAVATMIAAGKKLLLAGDEDPPAQPSARGLDRGTIPYFMGEEGGVFTRDQIYVTELPNYVLKVEVKIYTEADIAQVYNDAPHHGFSVIIIPASCQTHFAFALNAPGFPGFATRPLIGWVAGVNVMEREATPKVFDGTCCEALSNGAVVLHVELPASKLVEIGIVSIFEQGDGDTITFPEDGFATTACINGEARNFADYLLENAIDTKLPIVADLYGAMINTSFQSLDFAKRQVTFYAPGIAGVRYKLASRSATTLASSWPKAPDGVGSGLFFACNCVLNYLYAGLEGRKIAISPTHHLWRNRLSADEPDDGLPDD